MSEGTIKDRIIDEISDLVDELAELKRAVNKLAQNYLKLADGNVDTLPRAERVDKYATFGGRTVRLTEESLDDVEG